MSDKYLILGGYGLVGSAIQRKLREKGVDEKNIIAPNNRNYLDLRSDSDVHRYFGMMGDVTHVVMAAARVGGIVDNATHQLEFLADNIKMETNVLTSLARLPQLKKAMFLGSSCIYPKEAPVPIKEESLLSGPLEKTNEGYALAKIVGLKMAEYLAGSSKFQIINLMPTNMYGINDQFRKEHPHVIPDLIKKFHIAKTTGQDSVTLLGDGTPLREFLYVDDFAAIALLLFNVSSPDIINVGTGKSIPISELAETVKKIVGYEGNILWSGKFNGTMDKTLDITRMNTLLSKPYSYTPLEEGLRVTYEWALKNFFEKETP